MTELIHFKLRSERLARLRDMLLKLKDALPAMIDAETKKLEAVKLMAQAAAKKADDK